MCSSGTSVRSLNSRIKRRRGADGPALLVTTALSLANFRCFGRPACSFRLRARFYWGRDGTDFCIGNRLSQYASDLPPIAAPVPVPQPIKVLGRQGQSAPKHESFEKPIG